MRSILITGCNRGLGLGLVKHLIKVPQPPQHIFATCRDVNKARVRLATEVNEERTLRNNRIRFASSTYKSVPSSVFIVAKKIHFLKECNE